MQEIRNLIEMSFHGENKRIAFFCKNSFTKELVHDFVTRVLKEQSDRTFNMFVEDCSDIRVYNGTRIKFINDINQFRGLTLDYVINIDKMTHEELSCLAPTMLANKGQMILMHD